MCTTKCFSQFNFNPSVDPYQLLFGLETKANTK